MGQVCQINAHDVALALPNNLIGYVPITSISDKLTERAERLALLEEQSDSEMDEGYERIDLKLMFTIGQYLRAYVVSTSDTTRANEKSKRRIELSLRSREANFGTTAKELIPNSTLMASVLSVEDHGLIMDVGLSNLGVRGFMSSKSVGFGIAFSSIAEGTPFLCMVMGLSSNGKTVKLSADTHQFANKKKPSYLVEGPTVDSFLPGTAVEVLITDVTEKGLAGKVMGMVDVTADLIHSGAGTKGLDLNRNHKIGKKVKARIICTFAAATPRKLGVSLLDHVMTLTPQKTERSERLHNPTDILPVSTILEEVKVKRVEDGVGLFVDLGVNDVLGFVHISRIDDKKIENLSASSGTYKIGSSHRGRIIGYNSLDGIFLVSLEPKVLSQAFLRIEDIEIGAVVNGRVEKLIVNSEGFGGLLVNLADGISGLVPEIHMADVSLLHPEKKFKEGMNVKVRVLSTDPASRKIRLTLKRSLVNSEAVVFKSYADILPGMQSPGTIVSILQSGAVVQFYGTIRGFLPVSEMSEAYIQDPNQHFRIGQVVSIHVLNVDAEARKLVVSCKDPSSFGLAQQTAFKKLKIGELISGKITQMSSDDVSVELEGSNLRAVLPMGHLTDGSDAKNINMLKRIRVGQMLQNLAVLDKFEQKHLVTLTNKPSLVQAAKDRTLLRDFNDVKEGKLVHGFVKNIALSAVFVQFGGGLTGLVPKTQLPDDALKLPDFGFKRFQSIAVKVLAVDQDQRRFLLSAKGLEPSEFELPKSTDSSEPGLVISSPVDSSLKTVNDLIPGRLTSAKIISVKDTQLNVQLAANIQGRIDISQVFDDWEEVKDRKSPLKIFTSKQIVSVRILGIHDARNHRFLPITHRTGKTPVFELSAKSSDQTTSEVEVLTLDRVKVGTSWIAFVNNIGDDCLWVNLSPNVRGRIRALDISEDVSLLNDLETNFPIGSAIRVHVRFVDVPNNRLDLSARSSQAMEPLTFKTLSKNMVLPGKVTKVNERHIMVQLSETISGPVHLIDLADNFSEANPTQYSKNDIVRVCVTDIDVQNKRIRLSTRPSRVLNSSFDVEDPEILSVSQLKVNDVVRGFIKNIADNGLFVTLSGNVTGYVRVSDLSDSFIKEWKSNFQVDQLVKGKVISVDSSLNHVQLSLKTSVLDNEYKPALTFNDIKAGQVISGKIRKVEDFGVFIVIDGSQNVSGLCHRSEMADGRVDSVEKLYAQGDAVQAKVLKLEPEKRRISFGLKASYFEEVVANDTISDDEDLGGTNSVSVDENEDNDREEDGGVALLDLKMNSDASNEDQPLFDYPMTKQQQQQQESSATLNAGRFDWAAGILDIEQEHLEQTSLYDDESNVTKSKGHRRPVIKIDRTGDLDTNGPQSASDFERLLLGQPDSSQLWIEYMAFHMQLGELTSARNIAERAIRTINVRQETDKMNVWIALLNLENAYGTNETTEEVFKRACQYNDSQEIYERLTSIYIQSSKLSVRPSSLHLDQL